MKYQLRAALSVLALGLSAGVAQSQTKLYWGETHLHSNLSPDAYVQRNTTATPDDAFRFARGAPVIHANSRAKVQIDTPLDCVALTDHAEYIGIPKMIWNKDPRIANTEIGKRFSKMFAEGEGTKVFFELVPTVNSNKPIEALNTKELRSSIWEETVAAAARHNEPGKFTAFVAWEWSSIPQGQNLHRIVFMPEGAEVAKKFIPFSAFDSDVESEFWAWLDKTSKETGASLVAIPDNKRGKELAPGAFGWDMSASGFGGVWATENTREAITAAFKRREVYATSGPRIGLRVFGGWDYTETDAAEMDVAATGYSSGVPMGGDLTKAPDGQAPRFLIHAVKEPKDAHLDRIQMVKCWVGSDGKAQEKVYNVAWSTGRDLSSDGKLPPVGNTVDLTTGQYTNSIGAAQLSTVWEDPDFNAGERAFYYVRLLQISTPRNSTYDAIALGIDPKETGKAITIEERAYSWPI